MALRLERRIGPATYESAKCIDGRFTFEDGLTVSLTEAVEISRLEFVSKTAISRDYVLRIGFASDPMEL